MQIPKPHHQRTFANILSCFFQIEKCTALWVFFEDTSFLSVQFWNLPLRHSWLHFVNEFISSCRDGFQTRTAENRLIDAFEVSSYKNWIYSIKPNKALEKQIYDYPFYQTRNHATKFFYEEGAQSASRILLAILCAESETSTELPLSFVKKKISLLFNILHKSC